MDALKKLFAKIKLFFGIGTLSLELQVAPSFSGKDSHIKGTLVVKGKSDQTVKDVKIEMNEEFSKKNSAGETHKTHLTLGTLELAGFEIKEGEEKKINFELPFQIVKSQNEAMQEKGGVIGAIAGLGALAGGEHSVFTLKAVADVEAATFDPSAHLTLKRAD